MDPAILDLLEKQHRQAERMLHQLTKATTVDTQRPLVDKLRNALMQHMRIEEADVYPELDRFAIELEVEAEIEHELTRAGLQQLSDMVGRPGFGAVVAMVQAGLGHHIEEEEKRLFPRLREAPVDAPADVSHRDIREIVNRRKGHDELVRAMTHISKIA